MSIVKPLKEMLLVSENKKQHTSEAGIILDNTKSALTTTGIVKAIGPDVVGVSVGDEIYLDWRKGNIVNVDSSQYVMVALEHVLAVVVE